jgi:integrase
LGSVYRRKGSPNWWLKYYHHGKPIRESSGSTKKSEALNLLKEREGRIAQGQPLSLRVERIKVDELLDDVLRDYEANGKSLDRAKLSVSKLKAFFSGMRAVAVSTSHVNAYVSRRKGETTRRGGPPAAGTINRELSLLKRAFNLARTSTPPKAHQVPHIPMLREALPRTGFVEFQDYQVLKAAAPDYLKPIITMGYFTGMRRGEILSLRWPQVDLNRRSIRLEASDTKNRTARTIPLSEELYQALAELRAERDWGRPHCEHVFVRNGKPVMWFNKAWRSTCKAVGLEGLLFHDLRRSAVRNLVRSGVPEGVAMAISGHRTRSVFDRYNVTSEQDLERAAEALDAYFHASVGTNSGTIERAEAILKEAQGDK